MLETVEDLIKALQEFDPKTPILMAQDEEGNGFEEVWKTSLEMFVDGDDSPAHPKDIVNGVYGPGPNVEAKVVIW